MEAISGNCKYIMPLVKRMMGGPAPAYKAKNWCDYCGRWETYCECGPGGPGIRSRLRVCLYGPAEHVWPAGRTKSWYEGGELNTMLYSSYRGTCNDCGSKWSGNFPITVCQSCKSRNVRLANDFGIPEEPAGRGEPVC